LKNQNHHEFFSFARFFSPRFVDAMFYSIEIYTRWISLLSRNWEGFRWEVWGV
jgi:hypothetical protein